VHSNWRGPKGSTFKKRGNRNQIAESLLGETELNRRNKVMPIFLIGNIKGLKGRKGTRISSKAVELKGVMLRPIQKQGDGCSKYWGFIK